MVGNISTMQEAVSFADSRVFLRAGLNVPVHDGAVTNEFRIHKALDSIKSLSSQGAKTLIFAHLGHESSDSLRTVYQTMRKYLPTLQFLDSPFTDEAKGVISTMQAGDMILFDNLCRDPREKTNDPYFAEQLAGLAELYVNDAFSGSHQVSASIVGVPALLPGYAGLQFERELKGLAPALKPPSGSLLIMGGAEFPEKRALLMSALDAYDTIVIGGALTNDFIKAKGDIVGYSRISENTDGIAELLQEEKVLVPTDVVVRDQEGEPRITSIRDVQATDTIVDIGPDTIDRIINSVNTAEFILWNGPLGWCEEGFQTGTKEVARAVAAHDAHSIIGGGDTGAAISSFELEEQVTFLSTGGGAMIEFLLQGTLPGIEALEDTPERAIQEV